MTIRVLLISATSVFALAISSTAAAQQPVRKAKAKPTAAVTSHSQGQVRYADEVSAPSAAPQLTKRDTGNNPLLPTGTALRVKLAGAISTRDANLGDAFTTTVTEDVVVNGKTVVPKGATMTGKIARIGEPRRIAGRPWVELRPETVTTSNGRAITITAVAVDTSKPHTYTVNDEGRIAGPAYKKTTAIGTGALAGGGALAGAMIAGPFGSLVGAGTGATIGEGHYLVAHHSMTIPSDLEVIFEISNPVDGSTAGQQ